MQVYVRPFTIQTASTTILPTTSSAATSINASPQGNRTIRIVNSGSSNIYFKMGISTVAATVAAGCCMLPNTVETFLIRNEDTHIAIIADSAGNSVYVILGDSA